LIFTCVTFLLSHQTEQSKSFTKEEDAPVVALSFFWCQLHRKIFLHHRKNFVHRTKKIKNFCNLKFLDVKKCDFMGIFVILSDFFVQPIYTKGFDVSIFLDMSFVFFIIRKSKKMAESLMPSSLQRFIYHFRVCFV